MATSWKTNGIARPLFMAFGTIKADGILDSNGDTLDIVEATTQVAHSTAKGYMSAADKVKLDAIAAGAQVNAANTVIDANYVATDQNFTTADHAKLDGVEAGAEVNTVTSVNGSTGAVTIQGFSTANNTKLDGIEAGAQVNTVTSVNGATGAVTVQGFSGDYDDLTNQPSIPTIDANTVIDASYVATDENFTTADHTKLDGVEAGATADQTKADIDALNINADLLDGQHGAYYTGYTDTAVANIVDSSPATLDTLNELAAALGDDPNFATTTANSIGTKLPLAGGTLTGGLTGTTALFSGLVNCGSFYQSNTAGNTSFVAAKNGTVGTTLFSNGSATFAGDVSLGGHVGNHTVNGIWLESSGDIRVTGSSSNTIWSGFKNGTSAATSIIKADGSATFAGTVTANAFSGDGSALTNLPAAGVSLGLAIALG